MVLANLPLFRKQYKNQLVKSELEPRPAPHLQLGPLQEPDNESLGSEIPARLFLSILRKPLNRTREVTAAAL